MPKQILKIDQFHGGLNSNSDPRDIADNELSAATDVMVDEIGRIRTMGGTASAHADTSSVTLTPGYGLAQFNHDKVYQVAGRVSTFSTNAVHKGYNAGTYIIEPTGGTGSGARFEVEISPNDDCEDGSENTYSTKVFGTQIWMTENLKTSKYRDGTAITRVTGGAAWAALSDHGRCEYNNDGSSESDTYGYLYNWFAVDGDDGGGSGTRELAPTGWRVPSDTDWKILSGYVDSTYPITADAIGTTTATSAGELVDDSADSEDFTTLGLGTDDKIFNKTDVTWTDIASVTDQDTIVVDTDIFTSGEDYIIYDWDTEWNGTMYCGDDAGSKLAGRADLWSSGNLEDDVEFGTSGLNMIPGGYRSYYDGDYTNVALSGYFWSSSVANGTAWYRLLSYNYSEIYRLGGDKENGFSVRCVKDLTFTITIKIIDFGTGYSASDTLTIPGELLGGTATADDITVTVSDVSTLGSDISATNYLALLSTRSSDPNLDLFNGSSWDTGVTTLATGVSGVEPVMYLADGSLKICDGNFDNDSTSKVYESVFLNAVGDLGVNDKYVFSQELTKPVLGGGGDKVEVSSSNPADDGQINISVVEGSSGTWDTTSDNYTVFATYSYNNQESLPTILSTNFFPVSELKSLLVTVKIESTGNLISRRIQAINFYYSNNSDEASDLFFLVSAHLEKGLQQHGGKTDRWAIESTYIHATATVEAASVTTFESRNGFSPDETIDARYKTAIVTNRRAYIGNIFQNGRAFGDRIIKSPVNKFDTFPERNVIEASIQDGDEIVKLEEYADRLLEFKKNKMHLINVSQDVEFLEETFMHKGVLHPASVCKTDFGIAWVNKLGCYLYDGQTVKNLFEKGGREIIKQSVFESWMAAGDIPMIGYIPKKRQLIIVQDITGNSSNEDDVYLYDMVTQSWVEGVAKIPSSGEADKTNFITDWNNDLIFAHASGTMVKWVDDLADASTSTSAGVSIKTKDYDFGQPAQRKKVYRVRISYKGDADTLTVKYSVNGDSDTLYDFEGTTWSGGVGTPDGSTDTTPLRDASDLTYWHHAELKPDTLSEAGNIYSFQLHMDGTVDDDFEINDISIVYRLKPVR